VSRRRWLPAAAVLATGALLAAALLLPAPVRGRIGGGAAFVFATYAQAFSIAALGVALAQAPRRAAAAGVALFAAGFLAGLMIKEPVLAALVRRQGAFERTHLLAPAACILSGLALAAPGRLRMWIAPGAALLAGGAIGFAAALNDPTFGGWRFMTGAAAASLWLLAAPLAAVPRVPERAMRVAGGILASWLLAIGLMLGAATLAKRASQPPMAPPPLDEDSRRP
jgi:hypothetical protein